MPRKSIGREPVLTHQSYKQKKGRRNRAQPSRSGSSRLQTSYYYRFEWNSFGGDSHGCKCAWFQNAGTYAWPHSRPEEQTWPTHSPPQKTTCRQGLWFCQVPQSMYAARHPASYCPTRDRKFLSPWKISLGCWAFYCLASSVPAFTCSIRAQGRYPSRFSDSCCCSYRI